MPRYNYPVTAEVTPAQIRLLLTKWESSNQVVAWDYETTDASPWGGNRVRSVAFSNGEQAVWLNVEKYGEAANKEVVNFLKSNIVKTAHNLYFEYLWSMVYFGVEPRMAKYDTMSSHYLVDENKPHGLDLVAAEYLGVPSWDIHDEMVQEGWTYATVPLKKAGPYNALDAFYTAKLREPIFKKLMSRRWIYDNIMLPLTKTCARMSRRGIKIDAEWSQQVVAQYRGDMKKIERDFAVSPAVQVVTNEQHAPFNINSSKQIGVLFYDKLGLPVPGLTKKGILLVRAGYRELAYQTCRSVAEKLVETLKDLHPLVAKYTTWKKKKTVITNYLGKFPKFCDDRGMIHQEYKTSFVVTGRLSCAKPPAHSFPIDPLVRGMVVSRFPGGSILSADYKQLEVRLAVNEAGEEDLISAIKKGLDVHDETAKKMFGLNFTKEQRKKAKTFNFGVLYGMTEYKIASDWHIPKEEGKRYLDQYWKSRPLLARWMRKIHAHLEEHGFVESRFGRRRNLDLTGMSEKARGHALRQAGNFPIQSTGADICNLAAIAVDRELRCRKMKSCLIHSIHDSLIIDVHSKEEKLVRELVVSIMQDKIPGSLKWLRVPLEVDVEYSPRWGGATKIV